MCVCARARVCVYNLGYFEVLSENAINKVS